MPKTVLLPPEALDRHVITEDAWHAYQRLDPETVANFNANDDLFSIKIGERFYAPIVVRAEAKFDRGDLVNISARAVVTPDGEPLIGGFIVENQSRRVLIRAVGPTLGQFGVPTPLADPGLPVFTHGSNAPFLFNDDWNQRHDAAEIKQVSSQVTGFALPDGSKDASYLYEFEPGIYTVHLTAGGTALLEIYLVP